MARTKSPSARLRGAGPSRNLSGPKEEGDVAQRPLAVGIIGAGQMAQVAHIPAWLRLKPEVQIGVLCDEDKARLKAVAQKHGIPRVATDFEEVLRDDSIDAVDICTPNHLHSPIAVAAFRARKHVLCERPMARNGR